MFKTRSITLVLLTTFIAAAFFLTTRPAKTGPGDALPQENLVLGRLAYEELIGSVSGATMYVRTANADGTGRVTIAGDIPTPSDPSWSPNGTHLVYIQVGAGGGEVYVMNADGSNKTNLSNTVGIAETNPSWSAAGKIVYERGGQVWTMNTDGSGQAQFPGITQPSPTGPAWSADGGRLAFTTGGEVWKINADGTGEQRVTINVTTDADPSWSPDGTKIVFSRGTSNSLGVINADGTNEMFFTGANTDIGPVWSPDGTTIAFRRNSPSAGGIYLADVTGANQVRIIADTQGPTPSIFSQPNDPAWQPVAQTPNTFIISGRVASGDVSQSGVTVNLSGTTNATATTDAAGNYQFSGLSPGGNFTVSPSMLNHYFSPPSRSFNNLSASRIADFAGAGVCISTNCSQNGKIAFARNTDIHTMNPDGSNLLNITNGGGSNTEPHYSSGGSRIVFATNRDGNYEIYRMNSDGSNPVRLTNNAASDRAPKYSPDGASIVFTSNRDGNDEVYRMNSDGSNQVRLTNDGATQRTPAFSRDGQLIIFVTFPAAAPMSLWRMNADGSNQQQFPDPAGGGHFYDNPSYSPSGQTILFTYGTDATTQQAWTMNADGTNRSPAPFGRKPTYSPDGLRVVSFNPFFGAQGIYTSNTDGSNSQRITTQGDSAPDWQQVGVPRRTAFDFDGDSRADVSVFRSSNNAWYILRSTAGLWVPVWGLSTDVLVPADYDGDLKTDIAVWRPSDNNFYILNSFDGTVRIENFGLAGDIPTGGDFDGDSKAEVAVYRPGAQSVFYYRGTIGNPNRNITSVPWGISTDKPVAADFDGDGRTDAAVYRPSSGVWYVRKSSDGQLSANAFGLPNDKLVPADYDADGKTDLAVFRDGIWYLLLSQQGFLAFQYGLAGDLPASADYDGDGRAEAAVYRNGVWYARQIQSGTTAITNFGLADDKPIPGVYVR